MTNLAKEFKAFLFRGNIVDLAVAVVLGIAFGAVVSALVRDLLTPIIALIFGNPDFSALSFTINSSHFFYGDFINALIAFISVAAAIFFFVVKPVNVLAERRARRGRARVDDAALHGVPLGDPQSSPAMRLLHRGAGARQLTARARVGAIGAPALESVRPRRRP